MPKLRLMEYFWMQIYYRSTISVLKIPIVIVVFEIPIVNDSDSIGHPCYLLCKFVLRADRNLIFRENIFAVQRLSLHSLFYFVFHTQGALPYTGKKQLD